MTAFHLRANSSAVHEGFFGRHSASPTGRGGAAAVGGAVLRWFGAGTARIREYARRRRVMSELSRLSDRELADIGLSRSDIGSIYSEEFAARRTAER